MYTKILFSALSDFCSFFMVFGFFLVVLVPYLFLEQTCELNLSILNWLS